MRQPVNNVSPKEGKKHKKVLNRHLKEFYQFLDSKPKPSNEKVRVEFIRHESEWRLHCVTHGLGTRIADLFNADVSLAWEQKYAQQNKK